MTGVPRWEPCERSERYKEFVEILNLMLNNEKRLPWKILQPPEALMRPSSFQNPPSIQYCSPRPKGTAVGCQVRGCVEQPWSLKGNDPQTKQR
jgi:hypothetical protein